jgi:hypothetical protein
MHERQPCGHPGDAGHFLACARRPPTGVARFEHRGVACRHHGAHGQHGPHRGASPPSPTASTHGPPLPVAGRHAHPGHHRRGASGAARRPLTQPGPRQHRPHTGQTWPERCCRLPSGTPLERLGQGVLQAAPLPCPPRHGLRHRLGHARGHGPKPLALRRQPVDPVAVSEAPGAQRWRCGLRQGTGQRSHRCRAVGQHTRINASRLFGLVYRRTGRPRLRSGLAGPEAERSITSGKPVTGMLPRHS